MVADIGAGVLATSDAHAQACENDEKVHAENVSLRVILEADVDIPIDAYAKVAWETKRKNKLPKCTENKPAHSLKALDAFTYKPIQVRVTKMRPFVDLHKNHIKIFPIVSPQ